jgi:hypothetical protein
MSPWVEGFEPSFKKAAEQHALRSGSIDASTLERYFETRLLRINPLPDAEGHLPKSGDARVVTVEGGTSHALSRVHMIYLDVGCWAGQAVSVHDGDEKDGPA